jgi:hypothetical protein
LPANNQPKKLRIVMPGHGRLKNGVASLAYAGHPRLFAATRPKSWMAGTSQDKPGHDD